MAPTRRFSNGRSPLVNQQSQITAFFSKASSSSPSPSPSPVLSKKNPNPSPSPSPTTPSPVQTKLRKPLLVIGPSTTTPPSTPVIANGPYGDEVVNRRVRVYWPLDKAWYEGSVKSFDEGTGKHLVQYDDADEEILDLGKEKIEWVDDKSRTFRRLRRGSFFEKAVVGDKEGNVEEEEEEEEEEGGGSDEDWEKGKGIEGVEDESEDIELEDGEDEEDEEEKVQSSKKVQHKKVESRKRKAGIGGNVASGKKSKCSEVEKSALKVSLVESNNAESE